MSVTSFELYHFVALFKQEQGCQQVGILYLGKAGKIRISASRLKKTLISCKLETCFRLTGAVRRKILRILVSGS